MNDIKIKDAKIFRKNDFQEVLCSLNEISKDQNIPRSKNCKPILMDNNNPLFQFSQEDLILTRSPKVLNNLKKLLSFSGTKTKSNLEKILNILQSKNPSILIVGGGQIGNGTDFLYEHNNILSFDIYPSNEIDFISDAHKIPITDNVFDLVVVQAVLEHVLSPKQVVNEIYRVTKIGGYVYAETPFMQAVHEGAFDFYRFSNSAHDLLFKKFKIIDSSYLGGAGTSFLWSIMFFGRSLFRSRLAGKILRLLFYWIQFTDYVIPKKYNIDFANSNFLIGLKTSKKDNTFKPQKVYKGAQ